MSSLTSCDSLDACRIDLPAVAHTKMLKNARKYPQTHVIEPLVVPPEVLSAATMQQPASTDAAMAFQFDDASPLELFRLKTVHFADERGWAPVRHPVCYSTVLCSALSSQSPVCVLL